MSDGVERKTIVVDACVGQIRFAGSRRAACLHAVLTICHRAAMPDTLRAEWDKNAERDPRLNQFAVRWRSDMARRGKHLPKADPRDADLRHAIDDLAREQGTGSAEDVRQIMLDDVHLLEAALASDHIVISVEGKCRRWFDRLAERVPRLRSIMWVNPEDDPEWTLAWLAAGAPHDPAHCLGHAPE